MTRARVLLLVLAAAAACGRSGSPRKEPVARLPLSALGGSVIVSDDLAHHAYLVQDGGSARMVRDGTPVGEEYRFGTNRSFTPNANRHVYWARRFDDQPVFIVDEQVFPVGVSRQEYVAFDASGAHWAVLAAAPDGTGAVVIRDGVVLGPFVDAGVPAWSLGAPPLLAYVREQAQTMLARRIELVVGDAVVRENTGNPPVCVPMFSEPFEGPELPRQTAVRYLADGRLLTLMPHDDQWALRRDDEVLATFDATVPAAAVGAGPYVITGPEACAAGRIGVPQSVTTAEAAPATAWWERAAGAQTWRVMLDGRPALAPPCLRPWSHQPPLLAPNGRGIAFPCSVRFDDRGEAIKVVHGLVQYGPYPEVWALAVSDDGARVAYGASDGSADTAWAIHADGVPVSRRYFSIWRPRFDPSGTHLAWEATLTANGPHVLVLDGRTLATFDHLIDGPLFDRPGEVAWIVRRKQRVARLNFPLSP